MHVYNQGAKSLLLCPCCTDSLSQAPSHSSTFPQQQSHASELPSLGLTANWLSSSQRHIVAFQDLLSGPMTATDCLACIQGGQCCQLGTQLGPLDLSREPLSQRHPELTLSFLPGVGALFRARYLEHTFLPGTQQLQHCCSLHALSLRLKFA